ncbi:MAG: right-handed parallel beta-helix repeat-containing protein [Solirubrobacteraceae bacterium]
MRNHLFSRCSVALGGVIASLAVAANATAPARADSACSGGLASGGTVYYVSPTGSDSNAGTSPCAAWQSMNKVDAARLQPGDTVAFEGGQTFMQPLAPWNGTRGGPGQPIVYTSYGAGQANLTGGVYLKSNSNLTFTDLAITSATSPGIGTSASGSGVTNVVVSDSSVSSTYQGGIGGYGIGLRSTLDSNWTIQNDRIANTADSGVFSLGSHVTVDQDVFVDNGVGPYCGTGAGQNPCHAIYAKGPSFTITNNTITSPQTAGVSLRFQNNIVENNKIYGGQKGIAFNSETTTPGTTAISGNLLSGQSDTGILLASGKDPLYESFAISANTVSDPANYDLYVGSGPDSASSQTVTLSGNLFEVGGAAGMHAYVNLAAPDTYTARTYSERSDTFTGASGPSACYVNGTARTLAAYSSWLAASSQQPAAGHAHSAPAHTSQSKQKSAHRRTRSTSSRTRRQRRSNATRSNAAGRRA